MTISRPTHISTYSTILFLFMAEKRFTQYMYHIFFIHSSVDGHLDLFDILAFVNSAAINTWVHVSFDTWVYAGEGNGNPLQYSCLENPVDRGAWWAAVYGVAQSRTWLKRLSSSSSSSRLYAQEWDYCVIWYFRNYQLWQFWNMPKNVQTNTQLH